MAKLIKPRRTVLNPDQIPLITPDSEWVMPTELPDLSRFDLVAVDTETQDDGIKMGRGPGWAFNAGRIIGASAAWRQEGEMRSIYVPVGHPDTQNFDKEVLGNWLGHIYKRPTGKTVFCNAAYDIGWTNADLKLAPPLHIDDVGCQAMMLDENKRTPKGFTSAYSLDAIAYFCGVPGKDTRALEDVAFDYGIKKGEIKANLWRIPARYVGGYAEADAVATLGSYEVMRPQVAADGMLQAYMTEMALVPMIHAMRKRGIRINDDRAWALHGDLLARAERMYALIGERMKMRVGIDEIRSNTWLMKVCSIEGVDVPTDTEGVGSFTKDWMRASEHWLPRAIAEAKQCHEAATKFVKGYMIDYASNGRIHATINQFKTEDGGTKTHRFSYAEPPLQQMPSRPDPVEGWDVTEKIAQQIRMSFEPEEGELWFAPDYSQQEYRLIVHYAHLLDCGKAAEAVAKYNSDPNTDFHNLVVEMTGLTRRRAKDVNFAKAYGAGIKKFASMTGMDLEEAKSVMGTYDTEMPFVKQLNEICDKQAQSKGFIKMIDGARGHFNFYEPAWIDWADKKRGLSEHRPMDSCPIDVARERCADPNHPWHGLRLKRADTRKAMNVLIQGSAARQVKMAMVACWRAGYVPMLQIHDELAFSLTKEKDGRAIGTIMREVVKISVPMRVDEEFGSTWGTAKYAFKDARTLGKGLAPPIGK